jgi:hypothetical protein
VNCFDCGRLRRIHLKISKFLKRASVPARKFLRVLTDEMGVLTDEKAAKGGGCVQEVKQFGKDASPATAAGIEGGRKKNDENKDDGKREDD